MNQTKDLSRLQQLSEKTGIEMIVINEAEKIVGAHAEHYKRHLIISHYSNDSIESTFYQSAPHVKTVELPGISFNVEGTKAEQLLAALNNKFFYRQCIAFISDRGSDGRNWITISIIWSPDKFNTLRFQQTSGGTYLDSTEIIIAGLQELDKQYFFNIIGAGSDWILLQLKEHPEVGKEIMKICESESMKVTL
jgi:hypothetical protein